MQFELPRTPHKGGAFETLCGHPFGRLSGLVAYAIAKMRARSWPLGGSIAFFCLLCCPSAWAADCMEEIRQRVGTPEMVRGQFEQSKQIAALERPLRSSGDFLMARNRGVLWRTRKPFPQVLKLTQHDIIQEQNGKVRFQLSAEREPAVQVINQALFALFAGDFAALEQSFSSTCKTEGGRWWVVMQPTASALARIFKEIRLEGANTVQRIELLEASGDRTEMRFHDTRVNSTLSVEEARRFD